MDIKKKGRSKKGQSIGLGSLAGLAVVLVIAVITIAMGSKVTDQVGSGLTGAAKNATDFGLTSLNTFSSNLPTVALIVVAVVILGLISLIGRGTR